MQLRWIFVVPSLVSSAVLSLLAMGEGNLQPSVQLVRLKHVVLQLVEVSSSPGGVLPSFFTGMELDPSVLLLLQPVLLLHLDFVVEALIVIATYFLIE